MFACREEMSLSVLCFGEKRLYYFVYLFDAFKYHNTR